MYKIEQKIVTVKEEIKYYENLQRMHPARTLTSLIRNLKVRKNTLEELL